MIFSENRCTLCAHAALRVRIMLKYKVPEAVRRRDLQTLSAYSSVFVVQNSRTWLSARWVSLTFFDTPQDSDCWCNGM